MKLFIFFINFLKNALKFNYFFKIRNTFITIIVPLFSLKYILFTKIHNSLRKVLETTLLQNNLKSNQKIS